MKPVRVAALFSLLGTALLLVACGSKSHEPGHATESAGEIRPTPTPDYTPIAVLRTPAGLVLGVEEPVPPTPPAPPPEGAPLPQVTAAPQ